MTASSRQFIVKILVFTAIIFAIAMVVFSTVLQQWHFTSYPYQILLIATITTIGHLWIIKASGPNTRKFTTAFIASVTLKLMIYLSFILIYLLIDRSQVIPFVLTFITFYILFTVFEVIQVLGFVKKDSKISI